MNHAYLFAGTIADKQITPRHVSQHAGEVLSTRDRSGIGINPGFTGNVGGIFRGNLRFSRMVDRLWIAAKIVKFCARSVTLADTINNPLHGRRQPIPDFGLEAACRAFHPHPVGEHVIGATTVDLRDTDNSSDRR